MKRLVVALLLICFAATQVHALPVFHTAAEVANWQARKNSGPYKSDGDVSTNSPGDWDTIAANSTAFASNPLMDNWGGNTSGAPWFQDAVCTGGPNQTGGACLPWHSVGFGILHGAFATIVDPTNHNRAANVRTALLNQIAIAGTDFTNTSLWPDEAVGDGNAFAIANWLTRFAYAYSYVRDNAVFSAGERTSIDTWFSNAGYYWVKNTNYIVLDGAAGYWSGLGNRNTSFDSTVDIGGKYADSDAVATGPGGTVALYYDCIGGAVGPLGGDVSENWNNRSGTMIRFGAVASHLNGSLANDAQTKRWVKMWFKEWMTYAVFSNNTVNEYKRWEPAAPNAGWGYSGFAIGAMATVADIFARKGDTSLYDFSTSSGLIFTGGSSGASTSGGPKSLLAIIQRHASFVNHRSTGSPGWIMAPNNTNCGNDDWLIQPVDNVSGEHRIPDQYYIQANLYYRDAGIKSAYMRTLAGAPAYPTSPTAGSGPPNEWTGEWYTYPGALFMYGQMEDNAANPFLTEPPPSGSGQLELRVIRKLQ